MCFTTAHVLNVNKTIIWNQAQPRVRTYKKTWKYSSHAGIVQGCLLRVRFLIRDSQMGRHQKETVRVSRKNQVKCMFTRNYGSLFRLLQMKSIIRSASSLAAWASGTKREFLFDDLYLRSCGPPEGGSSTEVLLLILCAGSRRRPSIGQNRAALIQRWDSVSLEK